MACRSTPALAADQSPIVRVGVDDGVYNFEGGLQRSGGSVNAGRGGSRARGGSGPEWRGEAPPPPPEYVIVVTGPDGLCLSATPNQLARRQPIPVDTSLPVCPPAEGTNEEAVDPAAQAYAYVLQFWSPVAVPRLDPSIPPGRAITGLRAYMLTGDDSAVAFAHELPTPVGTIRIRAAGDLMVDWGDGTVERHATTGAPYPSGPISHVYLDVGQRRVSVTQAWGGTWQVVDGAAAGAGGALPTLPIIATFDLPVDQIQAVVRG